MALIKKYDPQVPGADADKLLKPEELLYLRQVRLELHKMNPLSENTVFQKVYDIFDLDEFVHKIEGDTYNLAISFSLRPVACAIVLLSKPIFFSFVAVSILAS